MSQADNKRVTHMYDNTARGTLVRNNDNEALVGVIWDNKPGVVHPCMRDELVFLNAAKVTGTRGRRRNDDDDGDDQYDARSERKPRRQPRFERDDD